MGMGKGKCKGNSVSGQVLAQGVLYKGSDELEAGA